MNTVKVLIEGYAKPIEKGWIASSSTTLIEAGGRKIIVDPGCNRPKLFEALKREGLLLDNINYIFLTHNHPDHISLTGLFENAEIFDELYKYKGDSITNHGGIIPNTDLKIIRTPGHMEEHCSLIVPTQEGTYVIAGDVFWWNDHQKQEININAPDNDPEHMDLEKLRTSRKKVLEIADFVIPGHGKLFKVT